MMAPGTGTSPYNGGLLDNKLNKSNASVMENENHEELDDLSQAKAGKPPRNNPAMRHSISQALLPGTLKLVSRSQS